VTPAARAAQHLFAVSAVHTRRLLARVGGTVQAQRHIAAQETRSGALQRLQGSAAVIVSVSTIDHRPSTIDHAAPHPAVLVQVDAQAAASSGDCVKKPVSVDIR
jgi:hypothetical protein